jgi:O-antigen ligase
MAFTALLFFRPQDVFTPLRFLHLAELAALFALGALVMGRLSRGLAVTRLTPELIAVFAFAAVILGTAPFSIWAGGAIGTFTDMYAKVVLIFLLMVNTLTTPRRIEQFTWLLVIASGYIAGRAVLDYARGINLIENGRVQGAVGGMFKNPNDLALNMVVALPLAALLALRPATPLRRATAALCALLMVGAIVATQSRSGTVGLAATVLVLAALSVRRKPGLVLAAALAGMLAVPFLPASYWERIASITNEELDQTGSREARSILLQESYDTFLAHPLTGVGAGQFKNYSPEHRVEAWRETHNVLLQVASELGVLGLAVFTFLLVRAAMASRQIKRLVKKATASSTITPEEARQFDAHRGALTAALAGWFVCALFASVAYNWTFYYLLALAIAPREILIDRLPARRARVRAPVPVAAAQEARA